MTDQTTTAPLVDPEDRYVPYGPASVLKVSTSGQYVAQFAVRDSVACEMRGGQGMYLPRTVMLIWTTEDGQVWTFSHAQIVGTQVDRAGNRRGFDTTQQIYLGDPVYATSVPAWLEELVAAHRP